MAILKERSILPGFRWSFAATVVWLGLLVLLPLSTLVVNSLTIGFEETPYHVVSDGKLTGEIVYLHDRDLDDKAVAPAGSDLSGESVNAIIYGEVEEIPVEELELVAPTRGERFWAGVWRGVPQFIEKAFNERVLASLRVTFSTAFFAAILNLFLGGIIAYALVRIKIPGKKVLDSLIDLPFAMPTAICGIAMVTMYAPNGPVGALAAKAGIKIAFTPLGITLALLFIGLPFVVRALQPALLDLGTELEDAAMSLGASRFTAWRRVIVPTIAPALLTGFTLAFARGLGEYGTVIFIAGNTPMKTEISSLLIVTQLEQFDYAGATAIALTMLTASLALIFGINKFFTNRHKSLK
ncbi:MAG: sulfate ABC transporter permease subunit CysT [Kiritimatiellae bacterium]|nr:sulfate ABC transporter permease subunit CysT [Kiritimatiellia bacterium]